MAAGEEAAAREAALREELEAAQKAHIQLAAQHHAAQSRAAQLEQSMQVCTHLLTYSRGLSHTRPDSTFLDGMAAVLSGTHQFTLYAHIKHPLWIRTLCRC